MRSTKRWRCPVCYAESTQRYRAENPSRRLWSSCKARALRLGLEFTITPDDLRIPAVCPVLGLTLNTAVGVRGDGTASVDRRDPTQGYTAGNVVVVSWRANRLKSDASAAELRSIADFYSERQGDLADSLGVKP